VNITVGGVVHPVVFTFLDHRELGRAGVMSKLAQLGSLPSWDQNDAVAAFLSTCMRRAGVQMTADEFLLAVKREEWPALASAIPVILGIPEGEAADPNAQSPGETTS
jgi:hypothetical protein